MSTNTWKKKQTSTAAVAQLKFIFPYTFSFKQQVVAERREFELGHCQTWRKKKKSHSCDLLPKQFTQLS